MLFFIFILISISTSISSLKVSDKWKLTISSNKLKEYEIIDERLWKYLNENIPEALAHTGSSSFDAHLKGVQSILRAWNCKDHVANAGLFHSIYGTEGFQGYKLPWTNRKKIRQLLGRDAERLVFIFCVADRCTFDQIVHKQHALLFNNSNNNNNNNNNNEVCELVFEIKSRIELGRFDIKFRDESEFYDFMELTLSDWLEQVEGAAEKANPLFEWAIGEAFSYRRTAFSKMADILEVKRNLKRAKEMLIEVYETENLSTRSLIQEVTPSMSAAAVEAKAAYNSRFDDD